MLTDLYQLTIIPVLLIALTGWLILRGEADRAGRRFLLFLLGTGGFLLLMVYLLFPGYDEPYNQFAFELPIIVMPALIGIFLLVALHLKWFKAMDARAKVTAILLIIVIVVLLGLLRNSRLAVSSMILPGALILFLLWSLGWRFGWMPEVLGLTALGTLFVFSQTKGTILPMWLGIPFGILYFLSPIFMVVVPALFLTRGLQQLSADGKDDTKKLSRGRWVLRALLAFLMVAVLTYTAFWGGVWDQTMDMGFGFMISPFGSIAAIVAGLVMTLTLRGKYRIVGLLYIILVPFLLLRTYDAGMSISHHELTEERAEQIAQALEQFHVREGYYPAALGALTPRDLLYIPQPIIVLGEKWCYRGVQDFYQLAAIYREYWSLPLSLRDYASAGKPSADIWACEERLAELKAQHDPPPFAGIPETAPTPVQLPTSIVTIQRETVQPIVSARTVSVGKWSSDGMYLVFGLPEISGNQSVIGLSFLKADTGEVCPVSDAQWETGIDDGLREHFAWLPDGRLLYVPSSGDMTILVPCEPDSANSTISYPVNFTHALDYHEHSGRVLLKNQTSFWILDGNTLEVIQVPNVTPNPYELHWDRFAWSPDGNRLAISRLNGQTAEDGSTLFVMDAGTGTVESELPLDIASDQSAPGVEWTSDDELLLHGSSALFLIDFRTDPPKFTDVLRDIFLLDISYPDDISTFAWEGHHLSVRVNHPHNQGIYIYHPESGQVEIIQPKDASPLLFFPNGEMVEMANYIGDPPAEDIYELMWVDAPDIASQIITVQGHLPRNYPNLFPRYLPQLSQIAFGSSQGVSVVSIPDGETLGFWELGGGGGYSSYVVPPSAYPALVVVADGDGLYYIPLP
jgi:WD40 repeat protein